MAKAVHVVCPHCDTVNRLAPERLHDGGKCGSCHLPLFEGRPIALNDAGRFDKHLRNSDIPLLIDFWAAWCGPCGAMAPTIERAAADLEPEFRVVKVDLDAAPAVAQRFSITSVPTLLLAHRGREVARQVGLIPLSELIQWPRQYFGTNVAAQ
jgi:thioredoxin 2